MNLIQTLSALLTPIIAVVTTYIAIQQYRANKLKLRLELFEKRYAIYQGAKEFILTAVRDANLSNDAFFALNAATQDAFFLFDDTVEKYIDTLREKGARLRFLNDRLADPSLAVGDERSALSTEDSDLCRWFGNQTVEAKRAFKEYLRVI